MIPPEYLCYKSSCCRPAFSVLELYKNISFPVYRKYINGQSWFRITGPDSFEEIRLMGAKYIRSLHEVSTLPERNFILDLVHHYTGFATEIAATEFENVAQRVP